MVPRSELRNDAAVLRMYWYLGVNDVRQDRAVVAEHGGGGLIATGFDAECQQGVGVEVPAGENSPLTSALRESGVLRLLDLLRGSTRENAHRTHERRRDH